ncbi:hypothetical protein DCS_06129 [Drechmeria coniospora]|uniref:Uncharacterized protein n=1 Tax=Drechmeria coniospora TaxID=98403 RepID=A0A151GAR4_DRECN|nr:hypothetical protein DCS_06129 [Drechmeria coniospora]KYK54172.1 hypothetical protein DCS_06129 [Drechmeria coniospora]
MVMADEHVPPRAMPERHPRSSAETGPTGQAGESSTAGSLLDATSSPKHRGHQDDSARSPTAAGVMLVPRGRGSTRRRLQNRSGRAGFLLHDLAAGHAEFRGPDGDDANLQVRTPESSRLLDARRGKRPGALSEADAGQSPASPGSPRGKSPSEPFTDPSMSSSPHDPSGLDIDSAQIVHMALNLSESRRMAARSSASRGTPPRLVPLRDAASASNLRQHLQQQRRTSRRGSPKPGRESSPTVSPAVRLSGTAAADFETGHDREYRYLFSASTLARAQKAKEHMELMAQYWRLLEKLPPLKPGFDRPVPSSPPGTSTGAQPSRVPSIEPSLLPLGRQYNPLQYIRNRKVRARERKVIDGERQGFGDVDEVRLWVDEVCSSSSSSSLHPFSDMDRPPMPTFRGADESKTQATPDAAARAAARPRRPRVDWFVEPCDMVADAYWLEQDDHRHLIEDRQWRKIFPDRVAMAKSVSHETADASPVLPPFSLHGDSLHDVHATGMSKIDTNHSHGSTRDRAKQKLQNIRTYPHRHTGSLGHHHEYMWGKNDSASELSDSGNESQADQKFKWLNRRGTISSNTNDLLQKQMLEMVAKEARERELDDTVADAKPPGSPEVMTPEPTVRSHPPSRFHSRTTSPADLARVGGRAVVDRSRPGSPLQMYHFSRNSIDETDPHSRQSMEKVASTPASPELRSVRDVEPAITLSPPWSRPGSPTKNAINKIKQIMRDKSSDAGHGPREKDDRDDGRRLARLPDSASSPTRPGPSARRRSSPPKKLPFERPSESARAQRTPGGMRLQPDDQVVGLRGMFKGPRLDTVIRGGVSKLGDILWKKDGSGESQPEFESTDESESERARRRHLTAAPVLAKQTMRARDRGQQRDRHFLDAMPEFNHAPGRSHSAGDSYQGSTPSESVGHSRKSSRFDLLKPPRIQPPSTSSSVSPPGVRQIRLNDSDISESESFIGRLPESVRDALRPPDAADESGKRQSRHWSIADKSRSTEQTRLSRREIARMRALILSSGIKAMEIDRRANEPCGLSGMQSLAGLGTSSGTGRRVELADLAELNPDGSRQFVCREFYPATAKSLGGAIQVSGQRWQASADRFTHKTSPELQRRIGALHSRLVGELSDMTRRAADEADETGRDLALGQPLKLKHVVDTIEKMLRRRRRRLRWVRRALWLTVEWLLVGFMWYVWFMVVILRVLFGVSKGVWSAVRWLLWM